MRGIEPEDSCYQDIEWTADLEVHLLFAMVGIKPVGIHRSFHMLRIWEKFTSSINKNVPPKAIWKHLETMYDLPTLDEAEGLQFPNDFKEFSLPGDEFEELMSVKRKGLGISLETENTDESSSDVVLGSLIDKEETDDKVETEVKETEEVAEVPSKKKKLSLSLKKRRRNEEEKNKVDNSTSDEGISNSETAKKKRPKRESETVSEVKEETQKVMSEDDSGKRNNEDSDKELVVKPQTPKDRKQAKNKKEKRTNAEDEEGDNRHLEAKTESVPSSETSENVRVEKEVTDEKKKKATPARTKETKLRRKASTEKSEEGTDVEATEDDVRVTRKLEAGKNDSVNTVDSRENNVEKSVESKKRTRKQEEESEKKNEISSSKRGSKEAKSVAANQKRSKFRDEISDLKDDKIDSEDELFSKRRLISSPAMKVVEEQDDDKRSVKDDKIRSKRDEIKSDKKPRRGSLKAPQVPNLKSESLDSRRLSRGDDTSKASSSDDMETAKLSDTEKNVTKKDSVSRSDSKKVERTYSRSKQKADTSLSQVEPEIPQGSTPTAKKDRQRDSLAKANVEGSYANAPPNKRKSLAASSTKRAARSVTSTPEPTTKRRRI